MKVALDPQMAIPVVLSEHFLFPVNLVVEQHRGDTYGEDYPRRRGGERGRVGDEKVRGERVEHGHPDHAAPAKVVPSPVEDDVQSPEVPGFPPPKLGNVD